MRGNETVRRVGAVASALLLAPASIILAAAARQPNAPSGRSTALERQVADSEYRVTWQTDVALADIGAAWQAPNRTNNLRTYFADEGIRVIPRIAGRNAFTGARGRPPGDRLHDTWDPSADPGAPVSALLYDTLRSGVVDNFLLAECVESGNGPNTTAIDTDRPAPSRVYFYMTRARNVCPQGRGSLGTDSFGSPRIGHECP